jgi:hypothetical protein
MEIHTERLEDNWTDRWINWQTDRQSKSEAESLTGILVIKWTNKDRQTDKLTDRENIYRQAIRLMNDRWTDRQKYRPKDTLTNMKAIGRVDIQIDKHKYIQTNRHITYRHAD